MSLGRIGTPPTTHWRILFVLFLGVLQLFTHANVLLLFIPLIGYCFDINLSKQVPVFVFLLLSRTLEYLLRFLIVHNNVFAVFSYFVFLVFRSFYFHYWSSSSFGSIIIIKPYVSLQRNSWFYNIISGKRVDVSYVILISCKVMVSQPKTLLNSAAMTSWYNN